MATAPTNQWDRLLHEHDDHTSFIAIVDRQFVLRAASRSTERAFNVPLSEVIGKSAADLIHEGDVERALRAFDQTTTFEGLRPPDVYRIRQGGNLYKPFDVTGESVLGGEAVVFRLRELTERRRAEVLAMEQIEVLELMASGRSRAECLVALTNLCERHVEGGLAIMHVADGDGLLVPITTAALDAELENRHRTESLIEPSGNLAEAVRRGLSVIEMDIGTATHWDSVADRLLELGYRSAITTPALGSNGEIIGFLEVLRQTELRPDNAELAVHSLVARLMGLILDRMSFEASLSRIAFSDDLTGLGNRRQLQAHIEALTEAGEPFGLLNIDLDQFAWINNNLGHAAGDELLEEVSRRLRSTLPETAAAFRPGGDEFVVIIRNERRSEDLLAIGQGILATLREPMQLGNADRRVNASIGISRSTAANRDPERILAQADAAMYAAKREGGAGVRLFSEPIGREMMRRMSLADELRGAIEHGQLRLVYQPIVDLSNLNVSSVEALVRWEHPTHGLLGPDEFVPVAEESTLILELDEWVLRSACRQLEAWASKHRSTELTVWINVSARSFLRRDLIPLLHETANNGAGQIGLELTERDPIDDLDAAIRVFRDLRKLGIPVAIDDFGTGRASLHRVVDFEPTAIKIDRSFVKGMNDSDRLRSVVELIIDIAERFDVDATAEGVERIEQFEALVSLGCKLGQGYLFGRPMVVSDLEQAFGPALDQPWNLSSGVRS